MLKYFLRGMAALLGLGLLLLVVGAGWLITRLHDHMAPPVNPPGQPSIALRAVETMPGTGARVIRPTSHPQFDWLDIADPAPPFRPWTRWWWPGGDVELPVLRAQLDALHAAGFGGVEIQPFVGGMINVADEDTLMSRVYSFDSPEYYEILNGVTKHAEELGMQVDLTNFSGWPPGGPQINLEDSLTIMAYGEETIHGPQRVSIELPRPRPGPAEYMFALLEFTGVDLMNFPRDHARLLSVVAARVKDGERSRNPFYLVDTLSLEADSIVPLSEHVDDGVLTWDAPEGEWHIVASYLLPSGEVPMGAAQKPQGFVVDHLREAQVLGQYEYAFGESTGLPQHYGAGMRGFFNDSLEFRLRRMSVEDILPEFRARRGYDLEPYLPALYIEGVDNVYFREIMGIHAEPEFRMTDMDERIRHDYQQTLSDLVIERFIQSSARWAKERGLTSRGQSYGMDIDLIRALGANTIPETEQLWAGGANAGLKFAASGAALYGRPLVSAESFVWINRDYMPTARRVKAAADKMFLAGINHIVYHGTPYTWGGTGGAFGEEGWQPFSGPENPAHFSANFSSANTALWPDLPALNRYIARSQALLRQGAPDIDVLVYYPFLGYHGPNRPDNGTEVLVNGSLPDADPPYVPVEAGPLVEGKKQLAKVLTTREHVDPRVTWSEVLRPLLQDLDQRGITWAWVNDHALQTAKLEAGQLVESGGKYRALLLPNIESLDPNTLPTLQEQLNSGVPVIFAGNLPTRQSSFHNAAKGDAAVRAGIAALLDSGAEHLPLDSVDLRERLSAVSSTRLRQHGSSTVHRQRRVLADDVEILFFGNQSPADAVLTLAVDQSGPMWWFDAMTGKAWPAHAESGVLRLSLAGFDSRFLVTGVSLPQVLAGSVPIFVAVEEPMQIQHLADWRMEYRDTKLNLTALPDWREVPELKYAHGPVIYRHELVLDRYQPDLRYILDLALVQGSAGVTVNEQSVGRASLPPFRTDISDALHAGTNTIEISIRAPLRNQFVGRALAGDALYANMLEFSDQLVAAGLMGPITLLQVGIE